MRVLSPAANSKTLSRLIPPTQTYTAMMKQQHVRPTIRKSGGSPSVSKDRDNKVFESNTMVEETRQKVNSWCLSSATTDETHQAAASNVDPSTSETVADTKPPVKGILRKPKYSKVPELSSVSHEQSSSALQQENSQLLPPAAVKDFVVERPVSSLPTSRCAPNVKDSHDSIEGYKPTSTADENKDSSKKQSSSEQENSSSDDPLILSSMSELLAHASGAKPGTKTANYLSNQESGIETDLSFSVMAPAEYQEAVEEQRQESIGLYDDFYGRHQVQEQTDEEEEENLVTMGIDDDEEEEVSSNNDEETLYMLAEIMRQEGAGDCDFDSSEGDALPPPEPRAFMRIWTTLSNWITPQAIEWIRMQQNGESHPELPPVVDSSDIGASRCAGLHSILKRQLPRAYKDLDTPQEARRMIEQQLSSLLRCFSYAEANPNLGTKLWRTMATVLVTMVQEQDGQLVTLPACAKDVGMTLDEYRYLCQSSMNSLGGRTTQ